MFRNILHSRRVNKARRRLMALLPPEWVTVPTFSLRNTDPDGPTYANNALDLIDEDTLIELFAHDQEPYHGKDNCHKKEEYLNNLSNEKLILTGTNHAIIPDFEWKSGCRTAEGVPNGISLSQLLHILMKTLEPESIFALDNVLRSSVLSGSQLPCMNGERSDCVFLTNNMYVWTEHLHGVRVKHDSRYGRLSMPLNGTERHSKLVCPCLLVQSNVPGAKGNGPTMEPKVGEYPISDTGSSGKSCVVLFDPLLAVCKAWRWPDLASGDWIRRLNLCEAGTHEDDEDGGNDVPVNRLCINPHHWSRVILTDGSGNLSRIEGNQCVQNSNRHSSSVDLRFEDDPDLICVGVTATQAVKLCQCRSTPGSFNLSAVAQSSRDRRVDPISSTPAAPTVSDGPEMPYYRSRVNMALRLSTMCTSAPSPSALPETWHSEPPSAGNSPFCDLRHSASDNPRLSPSVLSRMGPSGCMRQAVQIMNSSSTSSGEADCVTDSTELFDSSFEPSGENVNDCYYSNYSQSAVNAHHSSTSTSGTEEFPARSQPKKPRPLSPTHRGPRPCVPETPTTVAIKPWAKLSFWEETRHVGQSWFSLTDPLVRVIYDVSEKECHNTCTLSNTSKARSNLQQPFSRRRRGDSFSVTESRDTHCIRLSRLVNRHRCGLSSSVSKLNTSWIHSYQLSQCAACTDHSPIIPDKQTSTTQGSRFSTSSWSPLPSSAKRSSSWRQCYRLGNQGITLHLTPTGRVWIDNQTLAANLPLFVSSSFFSRNATSPSSDWPVYRVPAGCSILVFDQLAYQNARSSKQVHTSPSESVLSGNVLPLHYHHHHHHDCAHHGPVVHISLGKGWGPSYRRPDLTHCPARFELWINVEHLCTVAARSA